MPWGKNDKIVGPVGALTGGNPKLPLELTHSAGENIIQNAEIGRQGSITSKAQSDAARASADAREAAARAGVASPLAAANLTKAQSDAILAQQKVDQARAESSLATMSANSNIHGDAYLNKFVPPEMRNVVKAYARGDLGSRSGGLSTSMLPIIQHAMNYDPSTSGTNFPARVKMQSDLASGDPKSAGGSLQAFERMLLHGSEVLDAGRKLNNFSSGLPAILNYPKNAYESITNDAELASFHRLVSNYSPEAQKAIASVAGGQEERLGRAADMSGSVTPEALVGGLQADAKQAFDAMQSVNDRYKRIMGRDILDAMSPDAKAAYDKIMAGGTDPKTGAALQPADGWKPISGPGGPAGSGGSGTPSGPLPGATLATGATHAANMDPKSAALINGMIQQGLGADQINAVLKPAGIGSITQDAVDNARKSLAAGGRLSPQYEAPNSLGNKIASSGLGVGVGAYADAATGGLSDEVAGAFNALGNGQGLGNSITDANARKQAAFGQHPLAAGIGQAAGTAAQAFTGGSLLGGGALAQGLGRAAPYVGGGVLGAFDGAGSSNDNRGLGAILGGLGGAVGTGAGQALAVPAGAAIRGLAGTAAGQAVGNVARQVPVLKQMFGARLTPAPALGVGENAYVGALNQAGPDVVQGKLAEAARLGVPMSPADTVPQLTSLAGSAVRRSPYASGIAEDAFLPRGRNQIERLGNAVERDLGPVGNVPQLSADLTQQAKTSAAPLYGDAYAAGQVDDPAVNTLLQHPDLKASLGHAQQLHAQDALLAAARGEPAPAPLSKVVGPNGEYTPPDVQTIDYIQRAMRGQADSAFNGSSAEKMSAPFLRDARNLMLSRTDDAVPVFGQARAAYGGPMQSKEALEAGQSAFKMKPDELGLQLQGLSDEQLAQQQLGFRSSMMNAAGDLNDRSNPFEKALGSTNARQRVDLMHPGNPGTANLFRTRDLEGGLMKTQNDILGNSKTAQRLIADQSFAPSGIEAGAHGLAAIATGGASLPATGARFAGAGLSSKIGDVFGKRAAAKADELAPLIFNTDPTLASGTIDDLLKKQAAYQAYVAQSRPTRTLGMFGAGFGSSIAPGY